MFFCPGFPAGVGACFPPHMTSRHAGAVLRADVPPVFIPPRRDRRQWVRRGRPMTSTSPPPTAPGCLARRETVVSAAAGLLRDQLFGSITSAPTHCARNANHAGAARRANHRTRDVDRSTSHLSSFHVQAKRKQARGPAVFHRVVKPLRGRGRTTTRRSCHQSRRSSTAPHRPAPRGRCSGCSRDRTRDRACRN